MRTVSFSCHGHLNIRATHKKTLEFTAARDIGVKATCVLGVGAHFPIKELAELRGRIRVVIRSGPFEDAFEAVTGNAISQSDSLVFRIGPRLALQTFAYHSSKSAADIDRDLVKFLAAPQTPELSVSITELDRDTGAIGSIFVVALPIGNYGDMSQRALDVLSRVDLILAEDTRVFRSLARHYNLRYRELRSLHAKNETRVSDSAMSVLREGKDIALVSDAGTPVVSDPGYELLRLAAQASVDIRPVPGPSALTAALSIAGLPIQSFLFVGFLPRQRSRRRDSLRRVSASGVTLVIFEAPHRLKDTLDDIATLMPEREICIGRELTKIHEEVWRGNVLEVVQRLGPQYEPRGEYTLIVGPGPEPPSEKTSNELQRFVSALHGAVPTRTLASALEAATGASRNAAYEEVLRILDQSDESGADASGSQSAGGPRRLEK